MSSSSDLPMLFFLARNKLQDSLVGNGKYSLYRWVLIKNSILHASSLMGDTPDGDSINYCDPDDPMGTTEHRESSTFRGAPGPPSTSESEWLDTLLGSLADEDDAQLHPAVSLPAPQFQRQRHGMQPRDAASSVTVPHVTTPDQEDARYPMQLFTLASRENPSITLPAIYSRQKDSGYRRPPYRTLQSLASMKYQTTGHRELRRAGFVCMTFLSKFDLRNRDKLGIYFQGTSFPTQASTNGVIPDPRTMFQR